MIAHSTARSEEATASTLRQRACSSFLTACGGEPLLAAGHPIRGEVERTQWAAMSLHVTSGEDEHPMLKVYMPLLSHPDLSVSHQRNAGCLEGSRRKWGLV